MYEKTVESNLKVTIHLTKYLNNVDLKIILRHHELNIRAHNQKKLPLKKTYCMKIYTILFDIRIKVMAGYTLFAFYFEIVKLKKIRLCSF